MAMRLIFVFICSLVLTAISSNVLEYLISEKNYPSYFVLFIRGTIGLILCTSIAYGKGMRAFPEKWNLQGYRLVNAGLILLLVFQSYKHLSATNVSLLQRLDIPFFILLSICIGDKKSKGQIILSLIAIFSAVYFIINSTLKEQHDFIKTIHYAGFFLAGGSAFLLAISYVLLKKTAKIDNAFVITNITCISTIIFGLITTIVNGYNFTIHLQDLWAFLLAAILLIANYYYSMELYKLFSAEIAQLPSVFAVVITMFIEVLIEHKWFDIPQTLVILLLVLLTTLIALNSKMKLGILKKIKPKPNEDAIKSMIQ